MTTTPLLVGVVVIVNLATGEIGVSPLPGAEPASALQAQQLLDAAADALRSTQVHRPVVWH